MKTVRITRSEVLVRSILISVPDDMDYDAIHEAAYDGEYDASLFEETPRQDELWYDVEEL